MSPVLLIKFWKLLISLSLMLQNCKVVILYFSPFVFSANIIRFLPQIFRGASSSSKIGWDRKISLDFRHRPLISFSESCTFLPGREPRTTWEKIKAKFYIQWIPVYWIYIYMSVGVLPMFMFVLITNQSFPKFQWVQQILHGKWNKHT